MTDREIFTAINYLDKRLSVLEEIRHEKHDSVWKHLEKQHPQTAVPFLNKWIVRASTNEPCPPEYEYKCPTCNRNAMYKGYISKKCSHCGQLIDIASSEEVMKKFKEEMENEN